MAAIVVLAPPRSGSSMVAGILHHLKVPVGERLHKPNEINPRGFYEDLEFIILHSEMIGRRPDDEARARARARALAAAKEAGEEAVAAAVAEAEAEAGDTRDRPEHQGRIPRIMVNPSGDLLGRYRALIRKRCARHPTWAVKDPGLLWTLDYFLACCEAPVRIVAVHRDRREIAASLDRAFAFGPAWSRHVADVLTVRHRVLIDRHCGDVPVLRVEHRAILADPAAAVAAIAGFVGVPTTAAAVASVNPA